MEEENFSQTVINLDDYVFVPFKSKKKAVKHYIERVLEIDEKASKYYFIFVGGTARSDRNLSFSVKFANYENVN